MVFFRSGTDLPSQQRTVSTTTETTTTTRNCSQQAPFPSCLAFITGVLAMKNTGQLGPVFIGPSYKYWIALSLSHSTLLSKLLSHIGTTSLILKQVVVVILTSSSCRSKIRIGQVFPHEGFRPTANDIALLKLGILKTWFIVWCKGVFRCYDPPVFRQSSSYSS